MAVHTIRFLQAYIKHCGRVQDLFLQSIAEWLIHVAVATELYFIPVRSHWLGDEEGSVASSSMFPVIRTYHPGTQILRSIARRVCSCGSILLPKHSLTDLERIFEELSTIFCRSYPRLVVVFGDFNPTSTTFGSPATVARLLRQRVKQLRFSFRRLLASKGNAGVIFSR